jgi:hypothetical protein
MRFIIKSALLALPALALATQAFAQARPVGLSDSQEPGSVIIFPKFINAPRVHVDVSATNPAGIAMPRTEIEVGAVCPPLNLFARNLVGCAEHQAVKIRFHWVCPGFEGHDSNICREEDFDVVMSINGKTVFAADGQPINGNSPTTVFAPPCPRGYLIGWVIRTQDDAPIKFDALIGNAVIRGPDLAGVSTAVSAYSAIPVQASAGNATNDVLGNPGSSSPLVFSTAPTGGYQALSGVAVGDVRFDQTVAGGPGPAVLSETFLTLFTLDVRSNLSNNPLTVDLDFWNESLGGAGQTVGSTNVNFEKLLSTSTTFVCWEQVGLTAATTTTLGTGEVIPTAGINQNLTQAIMGTRKGVVLAGPAAKFADGNAPLDDIGPTTLIGIVETIEGTAANGFQERKYNFNMSNDSQPVNTVFFPRTVP